MTTAPGEVATIEATDEEVPPGGRDDGAPAPSRRMRFPSAFTVLVIVTVAVWLLAFVVPSGRYAEDPDTGLVVLPIPVEYGQPTALMAESMVKVQADVKTPIVPIWISDRTGEGQRIMIEGGLAPMRRRS